MSDPTSVPLCIKSLSNTTFVAEVTAPAQLVRDPVVAGTYLGPLVVGVDKIAKGAAFPEVRGVYRRLPKIDLGLRSVLSHKAR